MKYVILESLDAPIIFHTAISHGSMAGLGKIVSAGFCRIIATNQDDDSSIISSNKFEVLCWGKSSTLQLESREDDAKLIRKMLERALR